MTAKVKIVPKLGEIGKLMTSADMLNKELMPRAQAVAAAANSAAGTTDGFVVDTDIGSRRARASVVTATVEAMLAEAQNRCLSQALDAGR